MLFDFPAQLFWPDPEKCVMNPCGRATGPFPYGNSSGSFAHLPSGFDRPTTSAHRSSTRPRRQSLPARPSATASPELVHISIQRLDIPSPPLTGAAASTPAGSFSYTDCMAQTLLRPIRGTSPSAHALPLGGRTIYSVEVALQPMKSSMDWRAALLASPEYNALSLEDVNAAELLVAASGWSIPTPQGKTRSSPPPYSAKSGSAATGKRSTSPIDRTRRVSAVSAAARRHFRGGLTGPSGPKVRTKTGSQVWDEMAKEVFAACIEGIDPLDRSVKLPLFGDLRGRNEAIAIVLSLATGRYFDRKDVSSHAQTVAKQPHFPEHLKPRLTWPGTPIPPSTSGRHKKTTSPAVDRQTLERCRRYADKFMWPDALVEYMGMSPDEDVRYVRMPSHYPGPLSPSSGETPSPKSSDSSSTAKRAGDQTRASASAFVSKSSVDSSPSGQSAQSLDSDMEPETEQAFRRGSASEGSPPFARSWSAEAALDVSSASEASGYANALDMLADASDKVMRIENLVHPVNIEVDWQTVHSE